MSAKRRTWGAFAPAFVKMHLKPIKNYQNILKQNSTHTSRLTMCMTQSFVEIFILTVVTKRALCGRGNTTLPCANLNILLMLCLFLHKKEKFS